MRHKILIFYEKDLKRIFSLLFLPHPFHLISITIFLYQFLVFHFVNVNDSKCQNNQDNRNTNAQSNDQSNIGRFTAVRKRK